MLILSVTCRDILSKETTKKLLLSAAKHDCVVSNIIDLCIRAFCHSLSSNLLAFSSSYSSFRFIPYTVSQQDYVSVWIKIKLLVDFDKVDKTFVEKLIKVFDFMKCVVENKF